jgi:hypothetical protein
MSRMDPQALHQAFADQQSDCYRSARYWACRETFWRFIDHLCKLAIFLTSAGAVCIQAVGGNPAGTGWCAAAALATFALESFAVEGKITFAVKQCQRYSTILMLFPVDETEEDAQLLKRIRNERLMVEKDETILLECLDVFCHNKQCVAEGREDDMVRLTFVERWVGCYFPMAYKKKAA